MTTKIFPEKVWSDKGTALKGELKELFDSKNDELYNTHIEKKSPFDERNVQLPEKIIYKHVENKWSHHYIKNFVTFVDNVISRVNRVTGLGPKKITRHESHLVSLVSNQSNKNLQKPKLKQEHFVRVSKENLPFKKS